MKISRKPVYRYCIVPTCKNTIRSAPDKVFFPVPRNAKIRKQWCKVMRRSELSPKTCLHCCEDHFDIEKDTENYIQYKIMKQEGEKVALRLNKGVLPHILQCQKRNMPPPVQTMVINHSKMDKRIHLDKKIYKCDECNKCFSQHSSLIYHEKNHRGDKPYKCNECEKCFSQNVGLKRHKKIHTGIKPYKCDECQKSFYRNTDLTTHRRIHTGEKPYKCGKCQKSFSQTSSLKTHKRIHTGEKPYKCEECQKCFYKSSNLTTHKKSHTGEKPYKCEECKKCFSGYSSLLSHKRNHCREKSYNCDQYQKDIFAKSNGTVISINQIKYENEKDTKVKTEILNDELFNIGNKETVKLELEYVDLHYLHTELIIKDENVDDEYIL